MSDVSNAPAPAGSEAAPAPIPDGGITVEQAAERYERRREEAAKADPAQPAGRDPSGRFARQESAPEEHDAGPADEQPPGETEGDDPAETPPVKPPRSWNATDKEWFAQLPRETQERVAEREAARDTDFRQRQNEAAQARQAAEAELQRAAQERQRYEQAIQTALQAASGQMQGEFADIKSQQDVMRLAEEDPFRFAKFQAHRENLGHLQNEAAQAQRQRQMDSENQFRTWATEQDNKFVSEHAKELADPKAMSKFAEQTATYLTDVLGVPSQQLKELNSIPYYRDARFQRVIRDAVKWNNAQTAAKTVASQPLPPVQRPGTGRSQNGASADVAAAQDRFNKAPTLNNATALREAKQKAAGTR